jgi:hypothetical protein
MAWVLAALAYAGACGIAVTLVFKRRVVRPAQGVRRPPPVEGLRSTESLKHEVDELRSRLLEALAESSQRQRRTAHEVMLNRHQTANIEKRLGPVETGVEFLRGRSEQQQFDEWVASGTMSDAGDD